MSEPQPSKQANMTRLYSEEYVQKPLLRGRSHQYAAVAALAAGIMLVVSAPTSRAVLACTIYAASLFTLYFVSGTYHSFQWGTVAKGWWRRMDHAAIFVLIAGTYTPLCLLTKLPDDVGKPLLRFVWTMAALGVVQSLVWTRSPKAVNALLYVLLGWAVVPYWGPVSVALQPLGQALLVAGGVTFTLGAVVFATKFPDPVPHVFGYHEVFHVFVIAASLMHFVAVYRLVQVHDTLN
jgi:hemolysin III